MQVNNAFSSKVHSLSDGINKVRVLSISLAEGSAKCSSQRIPTVATIQIHHSTQPDGGQSCAQTLIYFFHIEQRFKGVYGFVETFRGSPLPKRIINKLIYNLCLLQFARLNSVTFKARKWLFWPTGVYPTALDA
ncbi:MAG: hypothetical protein U1E45_09105 [Geminicoccaceae bacterium]